MKEYTNILFQDPPTTTTHICRPFSLTLHQEPYKIIQKIKINGVNYRIDDLDNLYDFITFKFLKNLNFDD